ncbi:MAG: 8-oxoguanine deaminase [Candidatus Dormibacteraeota bacterium]|nr:8-oxoguanine deaminase [Candidatus Dormibacteraeota bacterium]
MSLVVAAGALVADVESAGELRSGWVRIRQGEIVEMGGGDPPAGGEMLDLPNCIAIPGLINTHDHFYQQATRGHVPGAGLFGWLEHLYPIWAGIDAEVVEAAARASVARLLLSGCTTSTDHHYVFPPGREGIFEALVGAAAGLGIRFHPCRGSMSLGASSGGLPPDAIVEDEESILAHTEEMIGRHHDASPGSMCRVVVAPCSPFSVSRQLMLESARLARRHGVRLHTHLAETHDEELYCLEHFGRRPLDLMEELEWTGPDVWYAHGVHFADSEIARLGGNGVGIAHCPSSNLRLGAGICRVPELRRAGVPVGLGVDGAASNEDYSLTGEVRQAMLVARSRASLGGSAEAAAAMSPWEALAIATKGGARVLGRPELGTLAIGQRGDIALFRMDDLLQAGMENPLAGLALSPPPRAEAVVVEGQVVVRHGRLERGDEETIARDLNRVSARLRQLRQVDAGLPDAGL